MPVFQAQDKTAAIINQKYDDYKRIMKEAASAWFARRGYSTDPNSRYCLESKRKWKQNIIRSEVADYINEIINKSAGRNSFSLHKYIHNGLSSQAMVINLFGPLVVAERFDTIRSVLVSSGIEIGDFIENAEFEYADRDVFDEKGNQPTSIDLAFNPEGGGVFMEAKFTETEFGGCSSYSANKCDGKVPNPTNSDTCYLNKRGRRYWELLDKFGFLKIGMFQNEKCPLIEYYQFFREVLFALEKNGSFVLLYDDRNPHFKASNERDGLTSRLWPTLIDSVPVQYKSRVRRISISQVLKSIDELHGPEHWISEFREKYGFAA